MIQWIRLLRSCLALVVSLAMPSFAQETSLGSPDRGAGGQPEAGPQPEISERPSVPQTPPPSIASSLGRFADLDGFRRALGTHGASFGLTYIGETLSDIDGGVRCGSVYEGRLAFEFNVDLKKLLGWSGASFRASAYQIHGRSLSRHYVRNLHVASGIEALPSTRLFELWTEQKLFGGQLAIRGGQLSADTEFLVSQYATLFMNSTFGWPAIVAADLPSGGPVYPLATPGARLKIAPTIRSQV